MEVVEFGRLTTEQRLSLEGDERDPFQSAGIALRFRPKERHVGLRDEAAGLIASAGLVEVEVEVERERFAVVGVGGVIVVESHRGRGLARQVVHAALARARALGPAYAMLFCHENRAGLYRKLGFAEVDDPVVVEQPAGPVAMPLLTMQIGLRAEKAWPRGAVAVRSWPF